MCFLRHVLTPDSSTAACQWPEASTLKLAVTHQPAMFGYTFKIRTADQQFTYYDLWTVNKVVKQSRFGLDTNTTWLHSGKG